MNIICYTCRLDYDTFGSAQVNSCFLLTTEYGLLRVLANVSVVFNMTATGNGHYLSLFSAVSINLSARPQNGCYGTRVWQVSEISCLYVFFVMFVVNLLWRAVGVLWRFGWVEVEYFNPSTYRWRWFMNIVLSLNYVHLWSLMQYPPGALQFLNQWIIIVIKIRHSSRYT